MYSENNKKSIYFHNRTDIFIIILVFILTVCPIIVSAFSRINVKSRQIDIYLAPSCEEFFGSNTMETLMREFNAQNPDLRVSLFNVPVDKIGDKNGDKAGEKNKEPDILFFDESDFNDLAAGGTLLPLSFLSEDETGDLKPAIPLVSFMDMLFFNIELLQAAGFDRPPKTLEDFLLYAKTISTANNGILADAAGAVLALNPANKQSLSRDIFSWIWASGWNFWPEDGLGAPLINSKPVINELNFLSKLYRSGTPSAESGSGSQNRALSLNSFELTEEQALEGFAQGKIAMIIASTRSIPKLREMMGDGAFGITTIPGGGSAGKYSVSLTGIFAGINKNCAYPDAARVFLEFLAGKSPLLCAQLKAVPGYVPDLVSGDNKNYIKEDPFYSKAWDIFETSVVVLGFLGIPGAQEYENAVREEIRPFFEGKRNAQETVNTIQQRWSAVYSASVPKD